MIFKDAPVLQNAALPKMPYTMVAFATKQKKPDSLGRKFY
jgi:hypothetical protein